MIIVIGSINLDLIATVDRLPGAGETVPGSGFSTAPGGKGANQALAAARAGGQVRMVGAVGKDNFAPEALALLKAGMIDLSGVGETFASTGTALILVGGDGENMIAIVPGANASVVPGDLSKAFLKKGDIVLLQHEIPLPTVDAALDAARDAGAVTILNAAPFRAEAADMLAKADYLVANETEFDLYAKALSLSGGDREARMRTFAQKTGRTIVLTLGGEGVLAATPGDFLQVDALPVKPIDTVGAGDTFCGYLAAGIAAALPLDQALRRAAAAGSLACLKPGAQPSIPLKADVDAALAGRTAWKAGIAATTVPRPRLARRRSACMMALEPGNSPCPLRCTLPIFWHVWLSSWYRGRRLRSSSPTRSVTARAPVSPTSAGTQAGLAIMIAIAGVGLTSLIEAMGHWFEWVRLLGAAYLVWMGIQMLRVRGSLNPDGSARKPRGGFFLQGLLVALSNPKTLLFFGAFFPQFIEPSGNYALQIAILGTTVMIFAALSDSGYALAAGRAGKALSAARVRLLSRVSGTFLVGGGLWLAFSKGK